MFKKLIGDRYFYKRIFALMLPIMVQNGITNFVNMLDNIMIGAVGTAEMTGVAVTNQLLFVFNLCIFGAVSGAGIFGAQYFGNKDYEGVRYSFRFKLMFGLVLAVMGIMIFVFGGDMLLGAYMQGEGDPSNAAVTLGFAKEYLSVMLIGLIPFAMVQCYSSTLREGGYPTLPMIAGVVAVCVNLVFNYILIFGHFGAPALGVKGAALATVISRFVELAIVIICTHKNKIKYPFMTGVYRSLYVPSRLIGRLLVKGFPLMLNETLWAAGMAAVNQCYSVRGLSAVAALNISQTFWNVFSIAYMAVGVAIGIVLGQMLGANELEKAKEDSVKMIAFSFVISVIVGVAYMVCAEFIPLAYNTEPEIRELATIIMQITAVAMPFEAITHASYFTIRSGGKLLITFIFDSGSMWIANVIPAFLLSRFTAMPFITMFILIQAVNVIKAAASIVLVKNGFWIKNIVSE